MIETILTPAVLEALGVLVSTFLLVGITRAGHALSQRFRTERQQAIIERLDRAARTAVLATQQQFVSDVRAGRLDDATASEAAVMALSIAKTELGIAGLAELRALVGRDEAQLDSLITRHIEAALLAEKAVGVIK